MRIKHALMAALLALPLPAYAAPVKVVASFSILGDMVHVVGGDDIALTTLVGPDGDAHVYEPTPADARAIAGADLVIVNGFGFEGWLTRLIASSGYKGKTIAATTGITPLSFNKEGLTQDPHAWQSVANAKIYIMNIEAALAQADPAHEANYAARANAYLKELDTLDVWVGAQIAGVPPENRKVITSHDAFAYFARDYGVTFIAPLGISTESEASAADIAHLIDQIRKEHVQALFMENMTDSRLIRQLESDGGAHIGGTLYSDALSKQNGPAATYLTLVRSNVSQLVAGMQRNSTLPSPKR